MPTLVHNYSMPAANRSGTSAIITAYSNTILFSAVLLMSGAGTTCHAGVFANYRTDFQGPTPHTGWSYLWNAPTDWIATNLPPTPKSQNGSLGNIGDTNCYLHLVWAGSRWNVDSTAADNNDSSPGRYLFLSNTSGHPGRGSGQADTAAADATATQALPPTGPNTINRCTIAAYTIQPGETGAVYLVNSWLFLNNGGRGGTQTLVVRVYVNSKFKYQVKQTGNVNTNITFDGVLGTLGTNDTIYVAVGPDGDDGCDGFNWNFSLSNVPDSTNGNIRAADYRDDYQSSTNVGDTATFANGWSYLWNAPTDWNGTSSSDARTGPIDSIADYELLKWNSNSMWTADADTNTANGAPANYLQISSTGGHPGRGYSQKETNSNNFDRFCIHAFQAEVPGYYVLHDSSFSTGDGQGNGNEVRVYASNNPSNPILSGVLYNTTTGTFNTGIGYLNTGDKIYVAVGPSVADGNDNYYIDYTLSVARRAIEWTSVHVAGLTGTAVTVSAMLSSPPGIVTNANVTFYWKAAEDANWTVTNVLGNTMTGMIENVALTNLAHDTTYQFVFFATNSLTNASAWSETNTFTTFDEADYMARQKIMFGGYTGGETLTNFPALVAFTEGKNGFHYYQLGSGTGADLRFLNSNLTAVLNHEIELWDTNGTSYAWVQVPQLASNSSIWAYWGNTNVSVAPVYTTNGSTWSAGYAGVWHFRQIGGLKDLSDSSMRGMDGIAVSNPVSVSGKMGYGIDLNGTEDGFYVNSDNLRATGINFANATISWWGQADMSEGGMDDWWELSVVSSGCVAEITITGLCDLYNINSYISGATNVNGSGSDLRGNWHFMAATFNKPANQVRLYVDGVLQAGNTWWAASAAEKFSVGYAIQRAGYYINATIDELQLSTAARSADWLNACFVNQNSNTTFCSYGRVDSYGWSHGTVIMVR